MAKARFTQAEIERAIRGAKACGLEARRVEITPDGAIIIHHDKTQDGDTMTPYQRWRAERDARAAQGSG